MDLTRHQISDHVKLPSDDASVYDMHLGQCEVAEVDYHQDMFTVH